MKKFMEEIRQKLTNLTYEVEYSKTITDPEMRDWIMLQVAQQLHELDEKILNKMIYGK